MNEFVEERIENGQRKATLTFKGLTARKLPLSGNKKE